MGALRFATGVFFGTDRDDFVKVVRSTEALGYDTFVLPDHLYDQFSPIPALVLAAEASSTLRLGTWVVCTDFHHPVVLARELATIDALSGGRLEIGLGAGYIADEYRNAGIPFEPGQRRLQRLIDSVTVMKAMFAGDSVVVNTESFQLAGQVGFPPPVQRPHPPILIGGGGPRLLTWAAQEANIVSILPASDPEGGGLRTSELHAESFRRKVELVRNAAGPRFAELTLNVAVRDAVFGTDRRAAVRQWLDGLRGDAMGGFVNDADLSEDDALASPYLAFGTPHDMAEHFRAIRDEYGASYFTIFPHIREEFGSVIAELGG